MNNMINFDSRDWNSICDTIKKINEIGCIQVGKTAEGEDILFDVCKDSNGTDCLVVEVYQKNGWIRKNIYNPDNWDIEEIYLHE